MMRLLIVPALLAATGCVTFGSDAAKIVTVPPGATVRVDGFGECETPCTVKVDQPRYVTIAKAGYKAQRIRISPDQSKVEVELELAAPTEDVDAQTLPDL